MLDTLYGTWYYAALIVGLFTAFVWTYRTVCMILRNFGFGTRCTTARYGEGSWAVVTGATDGIGKAAALYLAKQGFNLVLMSRTLSKLEACAKECEEHATKHGKKIKTKVIQLDFTKKFDAKTFAKIYDEDLKELDCSVLVNNVGMAEEKCYDFFDLSEEAVHNTVSCNMYGCTLLTREMCLGFKKRYEKTGKRTAVIFTSAMASLAPLPIVGLYAATKIYNDYVAWGMMYELTRFKVDVSTWRAAGVATKIIGQKGGNPNLMMATPEDYVEQAMGKMTSGVHAGWFAHEVLHLVWTNINDIFGFYLCQKFFYKLFSTEIGHLKKD